MYGVFVNLQDYLQVFEALANDKRLDILDMVNRCSFVSKTEIATKLNLNRANLNHHLLYLLSAKLIVEQDLLIDGRKKSFLLPNVIITLENFIEERKDVKQLRFIFDSFSNQNLSFNNWQLIRSTLIKDHQISSQLIHALDNNFFKNFQTNQVTSICWVCHRRQASVLCNNCLRPICSNCNHEIKEEDQDNENCSILNYCRTCIESNFS